MDGLEGEQRERLVTSAGGRTEVLCLQYIVYLVFIYSVYRVYIVYTSGAQPLTEDWSTLGASF